MSNTNTNTNTDTNEIDYGINKTIKEVLASKGFPVVYKPLSEDDMKFLMASIMEPDFLKRVLADEGYINSFPNQMLMKRIGVFELEDFINLDVLALHMCFGTNSPGKLNIFLVALLEFYVRNNKKATIDDVTMSIFPEGFYDDDTIEKIIDHCMKPKATIWSKIY